MKKYTFLLPFAVVILVFVYSLQLFKKNSAPIQPETDIATESEIDFPMDYCADASSIVDMTLDQTFPGVISVRKPFSNQTLSNIDVFYQLEKQKRLIALLGDVTAQYRLNSFSTDSVNMIGTLITESISPKLKSAGYSENITSTNHADFVVHFATFERGEYAYMITYYENPGATPKDDSFEIQFRCAPINEPIKRMFSKLLTYPDYARNKTGGEYIQLISSDSLNPDEMTVFGLNIGDLTQHGGYAQYLIRNGNSFELVYEGQETPICDIFEKRKIGKGLWCADPVTNTDRTVTY